VIAGLISSSAPAQPVDRVEHHGNLASVFTGTRIAGVPIAAEERASRIGTGEVTITTGERSVLVVLLRPGNGPTTYPRWPGIDAIAYLPAVGTNLTDPLQIPFLLRTAVPYERFFCVVRRGRPAVHRRRLGHDQRHTALPAQPRQDRHLHSTPRPIVRGPARLCGHCPPDGAGVARVVRHASRAPRSPTVARSRLLGRGGIRPNPSPQGTAAGRLHRSRRRCPQTCPACTAGWTCRLRTTRAWTGISRSRCRPLITTAAPQATLVDSGSGVIDSACRLFGIENPHVADASIVTSSVWADTSLTWMTIGEHVVRLLAGTA